MYIYDTLRDAATISDFIVLFCRVADVTEIVPQRVQRFVAKVPETDRMRIRRFHPKIDVLGHFGWSMHLNNEVAGSPVVLVVFLRRFDVRQQHDDDGDETDQRQKDGVSEDGPCRIVLIEFVKFVDGPLQVR